MRIAVFCTGGTSLGYGHFFRAKTFVSSAPENIEIIIVPVAAPEDEHIFKSLRSKTYAVANEEEALGKILGFRPDAVIFDTVFCSDKMIDSIKMSVKTTVSISPTFNQMAKVDYLFTRNANTEDIEGVTIYKGMEYAIISDHCRHIPDEIYFHNLSREFLTIGVSMGGGDAPNKTLQILQSMVELPTPSTFWVLLGEGYKHSYQDLVNSIRKDSHHEIIMAKTNRSMWNILSNCSVAIFAGGLTTIEAVYAGLPSINIFEKEDHVHAAGTQIFEQGMAESIGLFSTEALDKLNQRLQFYETNKSALLRMRECSKGKIDKLACHRIYEALFAV